MKTEQFYEEIKKEFLDCLSQDKLPWKREWEGRLPFAGFNYATKSKYSGINKFLLELICKKKNYLTNAFMTFNQVKAKKLSLDNAKGEGVPLQYWIPYDRNTKKFLTWDKYEEKKREKGFKESDFPIYEKIFYVFNAKHIKNEDGKSLEDLILAEKPERVKGDTVLAENILHSYCNSEGIKVSFEGTRAFYSPALDSITLPKKENFYSDNAFASTFAHEVAHSTGHAKRMDRKFGAGDFEGENNAIEELRAEVAASFLCSDFGIPMESILNNSKRYIQSWTQGLNDAPKKLLKAINDAEKIALFIEERGNFARKIA